jgi:tetratricopeptide (TPR) repeat protein
MFLYATTRKKQSAASTSAAPSDRAVEVRDLEARRDLLIAQLRDLADTGGSAEELSKLEQQAAGVLRQLDGLEPQRIGQRAAAASATASGTQATANDQRPTVIDQRAPSAIKGFLWGVGSAAAIAGLIFFVINQSKSRDAGGSLTGGTTSAAPMRQSQQAGAQSDPELRKFEAAVQASPDDIDARDALAHAYLERENMVAAFEQAQMVLAKAPADPRANTIQGIVRIAMGEAEQATKQLEAATATDPKLMDGWVALAWAYTNTGRDSEAAKAIDSAVKANPAQEVRLREVLTKMREQAKQQAAIPKHPDVSGGAAGPMSGAAPAAMASPGPGDGKAVKVTLSIAPGAKAPDSKILYIIVRDAGQTSGPPSAVKRVMVTTFPMTVDITAADSMMGQPLPATMRVEARLDTDGNAMTKEPTDLTASKDGVAAGGSVSLALAQTHT